MTASFNLTNRTFLTIDDLIDKNLLKIEILIMTTVFILALVGNSIVVLTFLVRLYVKTGFRKNKLSRMNFYIFHLSIADIYVSLGNILTMLIWRQNNNIFFGGDISCRVVVYFQLVSVYYSTYVLITMSIDRYEAICKPLIGLSWSKKRGKTYIAIAFVLAHLQGIPQVLLFSLRKIPNMQPPTSTCYAMFNPRWLEKMYVIYTWLMQFLIPLCIIVVCYVSISVKTYTGLKQNDIDDKSNNSHRMSLISLKKNRLSKHSNSHDFNFCANVRNRSNSEYTSKAELKIKLTVGRNGSFQNTTTVATPIRRHCLKPFNKTQKFKTIKLTLTVIIMYIICSTPYFAGIIMLAMIPPEQMNSQVLKYSMVLSCLLLQLNSCVNPWIYLTFGFKLDSFRNLLRNSLSAQKNSYSNSMHLSIGK